MRVRIEVTTAATELPWKSVLAPGRSLAYDVLARVAPEAGRLFHGSGFGPHGMVPLGHGAPVFPKASRRRGAYAIGGRGWVEMGSPLFEVAAILQQGIKERELLDWGGAAFRILKVAMVEPPAFDTGTARLRTCTPVVMKGSGRDESGTRTTRQAWLLPADPEFPAYFQGNLRRKAETLGLDPDVSLSRITWVGAKRSFAVGQGLKPGAPIEVELTGSPQTLQAIWSWGLGQANAAGFGWISG
ncbi:CRISPR-associated endoribonuclease Cas6 [Thermocatellispora tengchongensis]|uniref:CRISPR-associated endoribonuclease Cas6 n=1 Tax=Thermocatellispora tengchongensis TaxID=1073253 RepID=A0A840PJG5_9ACTN|nr:CRISPR-associated endoribonuclease Cas6 [Thermocatellispora tengchongensis]MBB5136205.1 CRISPR-associated endoribonuclease Cas6 [Thermocatellispora tengchongensis]